MLILIFMPATCFKQVWMYKKDIVEVVECSKTPCQSIPQVKRLIVQQKHRQKAQSFLYKVGERFNMIFCVMYCNCKEFGKFTI